MRYTHQLLAFILLDVEQYRAYLHNRSKEATYIMLDPNKNIRSLKSWLFTPATRPDRFEHATKAGADVLILDLEDAVALSNKETARNNAMTYLQTRPADGITRALRINSPSTVEGFKDLQALLFGAASPDYVILPKCDSPGTIALVHCLLHEAGKSAQIIALIESARGVETLEEIVSASLKPVCLLFGAADMAADLGATVDWEPLLWVRSRLVQAAALNGIALVDSPFFAIADPDGLKRETESAFRMGFHGKCAIHPAQLASLNAVFTPRAAEIAEARQVLVVNQQGVGSVNHKMVDEAFARQARAVLMRAGLPVSE